MCIFFLFQSVFIFSLNLNTWSQVYAFTLTLLPCSSAAMQLQSNERFQLHIIMCEQFFMCKFGVEPFKNDTQAKLHWVWEWTCNADSLYTKLHTLRQMKQTESDLCIATNLLTHAREVFFCERISIFTCNQNHWPYETIKKIATKRMTIRHYMEKKQWVYSRILLDRITHVHIIQWAQLHAC